MNKQTEKLRLIYLPFLTIAVCIIAGYTFFNWLIMIQWQLFSVKEVIVNFVVPICLPWIPIFIWLRPRIKLLNLKTKRDSDLVFLYQFIAVIAIAIPTIIAQEYLETSTGKMTELDNVSQIDKQPATKYYTLKDFYIDKDHIKVTETVDVSGKHNEDLYLKIYIACPILKEQRVTEYLTLNEVDSQKLIVIDGKPVRKILMPQILKKNVVSLKELDAIESQQLYGDSGKVGSIVIQTKKFNENNTGFVSADFEADTVKAWLGVLYKDRISNRSSDAVKEQLFKSFEQQSRYEFENADLSKFVYLKRQGYSDDLDEYNKAIGLSRIVKSTNTILISVNEPFESRNGNKFAWIFGSFGIGLIVWLLMVLIPAFEKKELNRFEAGEPTKDTEMKLFFSFFIPRKEFLITPLLVDLNVLVFTVMALSGLGFISFRADDLLAWGANFRPLTTDGEWWRLLTSTFLHGGVMHLLANMYGLIFVGIFLEPRIGQLKFAAIYLVTGILASITSLWWHDATVSVGASGAIFGLYGLFLALMLTKVYSKEFTKVLLISTLVFVGFNLLFGLTGGIDNAAHIGGLLSGFVIGLVISFQLKEATVQSVSDYVGKRNE